MRIGAAYDCLKYAVLGTLFLVLAVFLFSVLWAERHSLDALPDHDYVPEIVRLKAEGKLSEALEMARFVTAHPEMPGQDRARELQAQLERDLESLWGRSKLVVSGFVRGSGTSIEEIAGGIASDMIVWGDMRDLFKQGYYKLTGEETDEVIAALAGVGLLTEVVDVADWAPAVLKAFRKLGAMSRRFADFLLSACKNTVKARKLDNGLKVVFDGVRVSVDRMGLARTSSVFRYVNDAADVGAIARVAEKNADAAYFTVINGGEQGVELVKRLSASDEGVAALAKAALKGPNGVQWLTRGAKNIYMRRPQALVQKLAALYPKFAKVMWAADALLFAVASIFYIEAFRKLRWLNDRS